MTSGFFYDKIIFVVEKPQSEYAGMAELADAHGSGPCESNFMQVQVLLPAPSDNNPNLLPVGDGFGFVFFYAYPNFNSKIDRFVR